MVNDSLENSYYPTLNSVILNISDISQKYSSVPMMSKTHGQPATPTTVGKEFANFAYRINEQLLKVKATRLKGKINGAVGIIIFKIR
jgi:adenylosuccinate lyase